MTGSERKKIIKAAIILLLLLASFITAVNIFNSSGRNTCRNSQYRISEEKFFIQQDNGTYIYGEAVFPVGADKPVPLVAMAHGFKGTLNSGGAEELSKKLAHSGIAAVRMSFDPYTSADINSSHTHRYTLSSMYKNMESFIGYMISNYNIDAGRIGLYARSMGGRVAMTMANENSSYDYKVLCLVAPAGNETAMIDYMGGPQKWEQMKNKAAEDGFIEHQGQILTPEWFNEFENYNPCSHGDKFRNKPVLVFCNTLDNVVTPKTSRECAAAYKNSRLIEVTTENRHGYEMGYKNSDLKNYIMDEITDFFSDNL